MPTTKPPIDLPAARLAAQHALARADTGKPLPVSQARDLIAHAEALATHAEGVRRGRYPDLATSPDGDLVAQACAALGTSGKPITRSALATQMGIAPGSRVILTPGMLADRGLSEERRAMLRGWIAASSAVKATS